MPTMSSRISHTSESEKLTLKEIFKIFLEDFIRDFSFRDVAIATFHHGIFTEDEIKRILSEENEEQQTCLMFFILIDKNKNLEEFFGILRDSYSWLERKIIETHQLYLEGNKDLNRYVTAVHELRSHFPKHFDLNVHRLNYFYQARNYLKKLQPRHYLVIHGELGFGKKWLALDACCDYTVMKAMNCKIFWMDVHNCNSQERDLEKLQRLKILLGESSFQKKIGDYEGISNKILELQQDLRTILKEDEFKDCLLVLVDVQNRKTLEAFNLPCKILITTRNKNIVEYLPSSLTKTVHVCEGLSQYECIDLFERVLKKNKTEFPDNCNDIFDQIKGHPFLLNIIAQNLKGQPIAEWQRWINNLEHFRFKDDKVNDLIQLSFSVLNSEEQLLYNTLSIFHHSVKIPIKVLASLWDTSEVKAQQTVRKFDKFSLVNICYLKDDTMVCVIHFLYYSFLQNYVIVDKIQLHRKLIESYKIEEAFSNRTELDLPELPNDNYFYYFIGYHLREAKVFDLFPKLYLDFGFLGQKLRATGLASTIGDLKRFREDITNNNAEKEAFLNSLLEFLPNIEEMIFRSSDTCLLQYALMAGGLLQFEAEKQARNFPDKIWFSDGDHFHRRRQMIKLPDKPKAVKLIEPDTCMIALNNNKMLLVDLSLGYSIEPTKFTGHNDRITCISLFLKNYVLSLDLKGDLRVWSIADERRRSVQRKPSSRSIENHVINYESFVKMRSKECLQQIGRDMDGRKVTVRTFHLDLHEDGSVYLHLVFDNGTINIHRWDNTCKKFVVERIPPLNTRLPNIQFVLTLFNRFYMILNNTGSLEIFKLTDGSNGCPTSFRWPPDTNRPVNIHHFRKGRSLTVLSVFTHKVLQLKLMEQSLDFLNGELETLYEIADRQCAITCSSISEDNRYLAVGTKQGILVFDINEKSEVLRNSISESISCVDICTLDDEIFKYVIVSGSEGRNVLNIFGLKLSGNNSITWANSISSLVNEEEISLQFEPNAWLLGRKLFDVSFNDDVISLVAVDSKNRIHHLYDNKWDMIIPNNLESRISAIAVVKDQFCYGCENGDIFDMFETKIETGLSDRVTFLDFLDENTLIGSYIKSCFICRNNILHQFDLAIEKCFTYSDKYLILLDSNCNFLIINLDDCSVIYKISEIDEYLKGADLKSNCLALAMKRYNIFVYTLDIQNGQILKPQYKMFERTTPDVITSLALSQEAYYCAIGLETGLIEIYRNDKSWKLLHKLDSHKSAICDLKFSPWIDLNSSMILASVSEQICFWDVAYIINNPLDQINGFGRHSSRFNSSSRERTRRSSSKLSTCSSPNPTYSPWSNKKGPSDKPELLACIKFAGNKAEKFYTNKDFTKFVTIDDEGEYYLLTINEINANGTTNGINNNQMDIGDNDSAII